MNYMVCKHAGVLWRCALAAILFCWWSANAGIEQTFDVLQIGTHTYTNVTVTTKSKNYVFILHSGGMTNLKVADLPPDVLKTLGYDDPTAPKVQTNAATAWAKHTLSKLDVPKLENVKSEISSEWREKKIAEKLPFPMPAITPTFLLAVAAGVLLFYLFHCFCWMLICKKAGQEPGIMIWLPVLQVFPMLKAAGMSAWWFLGFAVPVLNIVGAVIFAFKLAEARGKTALVGLLFLLPITSFFAFLYLAFSGGGSSEGRSDSGRVAIMSLETV